MKKNPVERKRKKEDLTISALEDYLASNKTMEEACRDAGITYAVLQYYLKSHPEYKERIRERKAYRYPVVIERPPEEPKIALKKVPVPSMYALKLSDDEIFEAVKEYYETGVSLDKIGKKYGVSGVTLSKYIKMVPEYARIVENNARFRPHSYAALSQKTIDSIQNDRDNGMTLKECAEKYGLSTSVIYSNTTGHSTHSTYNQIPKDLIPQIVADYEEGGISLQALADNYNLPVIPRSLIRHLKKAGVSKPRFNTDKIDEATVQAIVRDYFNSTLTIAQIAEKHGVSGRTVSKYADEAREKDPSLKRLPKSEPVTNEKLSSIVEEFRTTGITMADLCAKYHISRNSVLKYIEQVGIGYNELKAENASRRAPFAHNYDNAGISEEKAKAIVEDYYSTDLTLKELAAKHGVSTTTVTKYVNKAKDGGRHH